MTQVGLVLPAAGCGSRFGTDTPKQLLALGDRPVLIHALQAFNGLVDAAVIAVSADIAQQVTAAVEKWPCQFSIRIVPGGATRQASVAAGLAALPPEIDTVLVHDAARPLVPQSVIANCLAAIATTGAAVVCQACTSTVKRGVDNLVSETVPREDLWLAQTPQGFRRDWGSAAFARAAEEAWVVTDDASILEHAGHPVAIVPGDACNLKITTPDDMAVAQALLKARR
ncbi:MAG: 2-C-methyl-D-erythritol 4-phosphate cytidylyltransferase [Planctomycetota bacterium]|jgi:2-C-methyl-D-erythritol 4-phosphate cytidylyltransferase|nr:2-C-methyl-D-erythritol 4-phosphate cytidylyltransferase [Planctomycetota bacterium]